MNNRTASRPQPNRNVPAMQPPPRPSWNIQAGTVIGMGALLLLTLLSAWRVQPAEMLHEPYWFMLHPLLETFSVMVSLLIFSAGWHFQTRRRDDQLLLIAAVFLTIGLIDYAHTMSYAGMPNFFNTGTQQTLVFSLAARFLVAVGLLLAILRFPKGTNRPYVRYVYLAGALGLTAFVYWIVLFYPGVIPDVHFSGRGPTPFYLAAEALLLAHPVRSSTT